MITSSAGLLAGILAIYSLSDMPEWYWLIPVSAAVILFFRLINRHLTTFSIWFAIGLFIAAFDAGDYRSNRLADAFSGNDFSVSGEIVSVPEQRGSGVRFLVDIETSESIDKSESLKSGVIRISWREPDRIPLIGERWDFQVRLFPPRGMKNPGGFDYSAWLFRNNIVATGYVRREARQVAGVSSFITRQRLLIHDRIQAVSAPTDSKAVFIALLTGERGGLGDPEWQLFRATGTNHLMAISGLHIGLVAVIVWFCVERIWRRMGRLPLYFPAPIAGAIAAFPAALSYAALAGFSIPTQRAVIMTGFFCLGIVLRRNRYQFAPFGAALIGVLLLDSRGVLSAGFWLSFAAVGFILLLLSRYPGLKGYKFWLTIQLLLSFALIPVLSLWGFPVSPISPLVNLVAVPWFSFVVIPMALICAIFILLHLPGEMLLLQLELKIIEWTLLLLKEAATWVEVWNPPEITPVYALMIAAALTLVIMAKEWRMRVIGALLSIFPFFPLKPEIDGLRFTMLDVGQGLAVVVETKNHGLVYDVGPRFQSGFNTADAVVLPYLKQRRRDGIDTLVLSHSDIDHTGSAEAFLGGSEVKQVFAGQPESHPGIVSSECHDYRYWNWDGVDFELLNTGSLVIRNDNDASCVLKISYLEEVILLTGDITDRVERELIAEQSAGLRTSIMVVPHHGSASSSSRPFVEKTSPNMALISAGWKNRYGHPREEVVKRWWSEGAEILNTASAGAIILQWDENGERQLTQYRNSNRRIWETDETGVE